MCHQKESEKKHHFQVDFLTSHGEVFLKVNNRNNSYKIYPSNWIECLVLSLFCLIFIFLIVNVYLYGSLSTLACSLGFGAGTICIIFRSLYEHFGKRYFRLNNQGLHVEWKLLFPIKRYMIPLDDIIVFQIRKRSGTNEIWYILVAETLDIFLPIIESKDEENLYQIGKKLNEILSFYNGKSIEMSSIYDEPLSDKEIQFHTLSYTQEISLQKNYSWTPTIIETQWNFICENGLYIFCRCGNFDFYSFSVFLLGGFFFMGCSLIYVDDFLTNTDNTFILVMMLLWATFGLLLITVSAFKFLSRSYHEKWIFDKNIILNQKSLMGICSTKIIYLSHLNSLIIKSECAFNDIFFPNSFIVPLFYKVIPWKLQMIDKNNHIKLAITTLNHSEVLWMANFIQHLWANQNNDSLAVRNVIE